MGGERPNFSIPLGAKKAHFYLETGDGMEQGNVTVNQTGFISFSSLIPPQAHTVLTPPLITGCPSPACVCFTVLFPCSSTHVGIP